MDPRHRQSLCLISTCYSGNRKIRPISSVQHPLNVNNQLVQLGVSDPIIIGASLLHDVLEDGLATEQEIKKISYDIFLLVESMTDSKELCKDRRLSWEQRKNNKLQKINNSKSEQMLLICASDILENLCSLIADFDYVGEKVFEMLSAGREKQHFYFDQAGKILFQKSIELNHKNLKTLLLDILNKTHAFFG